MGTQINFYKRFGTELVFWRVGRLFLVLLESAHWPCNRCFICSYTTLGRDWRDTFSMDRLFVCVCSTTWAGQWPRAAGAVWEASVQGVSALLCPVHHLCCGVPPSGMHTNQPYRQKEARQAHFTCSAGTQRPMMLIWMYLFELYLLI